MFTKDQLCAACGEGNDVLVKEIMDSGEVDINSGDKDGDTPLHWAMWLNHPSTVAMLLSSSSIKLDSINMWGYTPLHYACHNNAVSCVSTYISDYR